MSSGVEADVALDAAVIASLGLVRVMGGAAGVAAAGAGALAALAEGRAEVRAQRIEEARRYEEAIAGVLDRNARIAALADAARRHHVQHVELPSPHEPAGQPVGELTAWCERVDADLAEAEAELSDAIASAASGRIFAAASRSLRARPAPTAAEAPRPNPARDETLTRVLARLLPDAADGDRQRVTEAAERAASAPTSGEAEGLLTEVRLRIQEANRRTRERRDGRAAAARFLRELEHEPAADGLRPRLTEAATGAHLFDEDLRAQAVRLVARAQARAEQRYVAGALRAAFGELGYNVDEGFETLTARDGEAVLTRDDWPEHAVKVRVEDARVVRLALLRTRAAESDDQRRLDIEREEQWCASFEAARERLDAAGVRADVRRRVEPGERRLPVTGRTGSRAQPRERRRERDR